VIVVVTAADVSVAVPFVWWCAWPAAEGWWVRCPVSDVTTSTLPLLGLFGKQVLSHVLL